MKYRYVKSKFHHCQAKLEMPLRGQIKRIISIVSYSTFRRWIAEGVTKKQLKRGRPRKTTQEIIDLIVRMAKENKLQG